MTQPIADATLVANPQQHWEAIRRCGAEFADEIDGLAAAATPLSRGQLHRIARFFRGNATFEEAVARPDVLAMSHELLNMDATDSWSQPQLARAARIGFCHLSQQAPVGQRLFSVLAYPALLAIGGMGILLMFAFWISPEFELMFEDFGIELPVLTVSLFRFAVFLRACWWLFPIAVIVLVVVTYAVMLWRGVQLDGSSFGFSPRFTTKRQALAVWADHVSVLRELNFPNATACEIATRCYAGKPAVVSQAGLVMDGSSNDATVQRPPMPEMKFRLLRHAAMLPVSPANNAILREVANYYRQRTLVVGDWWILLLAYAIQLAIMLFVLFCVLTIFMPLISIIGGLTGGY